MFSSAFYSGDLGPLMSQFGLGEGSTQAAATGGDCVHDMCVGIVTCMCVVCVCVCTDVLGFARALEKELKSKDEAEDESK